MLRWLLLQDVLRLLNLWFRYGAIDEVRRELDEGFKQVPIDTWLVVVPQMMARLHTAEKEIIQPLTELLIKIGRNHPQALMYPLLVRPRPLPMCFSLTTKGYDHPMCLPSLGVCCAIAGDLQLRVSDQIPSL